MTSPSPKGNSFSFNISLTLANEGLIRARWSITSNLNACAGLNQPPGGADMLQIRELLPHLRPASRFGSFGFGFFSLWAYGPQLEKAAQATSWTDLASIPAASPLTLRFSIAIVLLTSQNENLCWNSLRWFLIRACIF